MSFVTAFQRNKFCFHYFFHKTASFLFAVLPKSHLWNFRDWLLLIILPLSSFSSPEFVCLWGREEFEEGSFAQILPRRIELYILFYCLQIRNMVVACKQGGDTWKINVRSVMCRVSAVKDNIFFSLHTHKNSINDFCIITISLALLLLLPFLTCLHPT